MTADHDWPEFGDMPEGAWENPWIVARLRAFQWSRGYTPVPVYGRDCPDWVAAPGKQPCGDGWQQYARMDPPPCATVEESNERSLNTGLLCDR